MVQSVTMFCDSSRDAPVPMYPLAHLQSETLVKEDARVVGARAGQLMHVVPLVLEKVPEAHEPVTADNPVVAQ